MSTILNLISIKENNYIFQKKIIWTTQKRHNFACDNYIFPKTKTRENKNKHWTHFSTLKTRAVDLGQEKMLVLFSIQLFTMMGSVGQYLLYYS